MSRRRLDPLAALLFALAAAGVAEAQADPKAPAEPAKPWRRVELTIGGYLADLSSEVEIESESGLGVSFDPENSLDLDNSVQRFQIQASVLLGERHRLSADYVDLSRTASNDIGTEIQIGDSVFPIGTHVETKFDLQLFSIVYGYSFFQDERMDIALTFGIHHLRMRLDLEASSIGEAESERFLLPVPLPGLRASFAVTPTVFFRQEIEILYLPLDYFQGLYLEASLALEWTPFRHLGFGIGWQSTRIRMNMDEDEFPAVEFQGQLDIDLSGLMLYTIFYF